MIALAEQSVAHRLRQRYPDLSERAVLRLIREAREHEYGA